MTLEKANEKIDKILKRYKKEEDYYKKIIYDYQLLDKILDGLKRKYYKKIMRVERKIRDVDY